MSLEKTSIDNNYLEGFLSQLMTIVSDIGST